MDKGLFTSLLPVIGVVIGAVLTFSAQSVLSSRQQESDIRKKALEIKNEQCVALWKEFADTYQYLYFSGGYSTDKIDMSKLGQHIKVLNVAVIRAEPYISHEAFLDLMKVRETLNNYYIEYEKAVPSFENHMAFINKLEKPMNVARDVFRRELNLVELGVVPK